MMAGNEQEGTPQQEGIRKIKLPEARTWPPEVDGNFRSWGRGGAWAQGGKAAGRDLEREAG